MSAPVVEFARGLELVCRHINPPAAPLPEPIPLPYLGLDGLALRGDDPRLAYRYLRGLEIPASRGGLSQAKPVWAAECGLMAPVTAALEVEAGVLAIGDATGVIRLFVRAGRARWECAAVLPAHGGAVRDMCRLQGRGFASVSEDGGIMVHERDWRGAWRYAPPRLANVMTMQLGAICQLPDGMLLVGGVGARLITLARLPSGEWEGQDPLAAVDDAEVVALAPWSDSGYGTLQSGRATCWLRDGTTVRSLPTPTGFGPITDLASWGEGVIACTEAGELLYLARTQRDGQDAVEVVGDRAASARMQGVRVLDAHHVVTWSEDQQVRVWKGQERSFTLRAAFPGALLTRRCFAVLSDERIVFSEPRAFSVAAPQLDGTWRSEEVVSAYESPIAALAALARDRVAFVQGTALHILTDTLGAVRAERLLPGPTAVTALSALDPHAVAIGGADGRLSFARLESEGWKLTEVRTAHQGAVEHLSAMGGHAASADASGLVAHWYWANANLLPGATFSVPAPVLALACDDHGRIATATRGELVVRQVGGVSESGPSEVARIASPDYTSLIWDRDDLLAVDRNGAVTRIRPTPTVQLSPEWPGWYSPVPAKVALVGMGATAAGTGAQIAYARGTAPIEVGPAVRFACPHAQVTALSARDDVLYVAADALYLCQPAANPPVMRRIVLTADAIVDARLSPGGAIISASVRRLDGEPWTTVSVAGKAVPRDPVLHKLVAVVEESGQLSEISSTNNYFLSPDLRELRIEDPTIPPE